MKRVTQVFKDLMTPDDQQESWYGWATNQMSHAFLGAIVAAILGVWGVLVALILGVIKEASDLTKAAKLLDSVMDVTFWTLGAASVTFSEYIYLVLIALAVLLYYGIRPRIKK
jgi:hypothetical protein